MKEKLELERDKFENELDIYSKRIINYKKDLDIANKKSMSVKGLIEETNKRENVVREFLIKIGIKVNLKNMLNPDSLLKIYRNQMNSYATKF